MKELNNIYEITNKESYQCFMEDEWKDHNLSWYSSINQNVIPTYEEMKAKVGNTREGNFYLRVVNNDINGKTEVIVHRSKTAALKDVKDYPTINVNKDIKRITQPLRVERAEELAIAYQTNGDDFKQMFKDGNYTDYEQKAARSIIRYGAEWYKHVNEMEPITPAKVESVVVEKEMSFDEMLGKLQQRLDEAQDFASKLAAAKEIKDFKEQHPSQKDDKSHDKSHRDDKDNR